MSRVNQGWRPAPWLASIPERAGRQASERTSACVCVDKQDRSGDR